MDLSIIITTAIQFLAVKFPITVSILAIVGLARSFNKPLFTFFHAIVDITPSQKDNELLGKAESSKIYKGLVFVLDLLFSVKLPK